MALSSCTLSRLTWLLMAQVPVYLSFNPDVQREQTNVTFTVGLVGVGNGHIDPIADATTVVVQHIPAPVIAFVTGERLEQVSVQA